MENNPADGTAPFSDGFNLSRPSQQARNAQSPMSALASPSPAASRSVPFARPIRTIQPAQTPQAIETTHSIQTASNFQVVQPTQQVTINLPAPPIPNMYAGSNSTDTLSNLPMELLLTVVDFLPPESRATLSISTRRLHERLGPRYPSQNLYAVRFPFGTPISTILEETRGRIDRFLDILARNIHDGRLPCKAHYMIHHGDFAQQAANAAAQAAATQAAAAQPAIPQPTIPQPALTPIIASQDRVSRRSRVRRRMVRRQPSSDPPTSGPQPTYSTRGPTTSQGPPTVTAPSPQPQQYNGPLPTIPPGTQPRNPTPYYESRRRAHGYGAEFSTSYERESEEYLAERAQRGSWGMGRGDSGEQRGTQTGGYNRDSGAQHGSGARQMLGTIGQESGGRQAHESDISWEGTEERERGGRQPRGRETREPGAESGF